MNKTFETIYYKGNVSFNNTDIIIDGEITDEISDDFVSFIAPSPAQSMTSFTGSGLPWANKEQAFHNTPNKGAVKLNKNRFVIQLFRPNSYYVEFDRLQLPHVQIQYNKTKIFTIDLSFEKIAHRSLQHPTLRNMEKQAFYNRQLPIRSQEQILRDSEYNDMNEPKDFWGLKPPC
jgi:hypothetical protein